LLKHSKEDLIWDLISTGTIAMGFAVGDRDWAQPPNSMG
jgi:hypothetical protein